MNMRRKSAVWILSLAAGMMTCPSLADSRWGVEAGMLETEAKTLDADSPWKGAPFFCYVVPAISAIRRLPDTLPPDGEIDHRIMVVGAKGEFVPASFIVAPLKDVAALEIKASDLRPVGDARRPAIPAENVDIKVVKVWWQPGTAWNSYFSDPARRELVPEVLLNDENLILVDMENQENYLRVDYPDGPQYVWISYGYPRRAFGRRDLEFDFHNEPVEDSPVLLPVKLEAGKLKQFWITVKIPEDTEPGVFESHITLNADGGEERIMKLLLNVLPFMLPDPKTYYDLDRSFIVAMDDLCDMRGFYVKSKRSDVDWDLVEKRTRNLYANQRNHNIFNFSGPYFHCINPWHENIVLANVLGDQEGINYIKRQFRLIREAGFRPPLIGAARATITALMRSKQHVKETDNTDEIFNQFIRSSKKLLDLVESELGHRDVYFWGAGEPSRQTLEAQFDGWKALKSIGVKIGQEGANWHFPVAGYAEDLINLAGTFYDRKYTAPWHALGHRVISYANPHPGAENPDMSRRIHGMMLYKSNFDGTKNNAWIYPRHNWLQHWDQTGYRHRMVYPTRTDVIDTLAWEAFREGIDDIRYATKLKMLAADAIDSGDVDATYAAKKALLWLELHDEKSADLNAMRMEMINYIMRLKELRDG